MLHFRIAMLHIRVAMLRARVATLHPPCSNAARPCSNAASPCSNAALPCSNVASSVRRCRACCCKRYTSGYLRIALDISYQPTCCLVTKSKTVRPPILAAVGGMGVLDKHIRPVPARELSFLLLPQGSFGVLRRES